VNIISQLHVLIEKERKSQTEGIDIKQLYQRFSSRYIKQESFLPLYPVIL